MPDFVFTPEYALPTTPTRRWDANIEAIKTVNRIEAEGRPATPEEQAVLARYSGFGDSSFEQGFRSYTRDDSWRKRGEELREITTPEEYRSIEESRLNAFYTTPEVVKAVWSGLERMGANDLEKPRILEPSAGAGRFLGMQPAEMAARSDRTAVELDQLTGRILRNAYPDTNVMITGFEKAPIPDNSIDIAVSNVPFGDFGVTDRTYKDKRFVTNRIHNYFFAKTLDKLRPGGVMAYVTTHGTMDAPATKRLREHLAERADLVGAVRLPKDAFPDTQVVTDIIYLRKRMPGEQRGNTDWVNSQKVRLPTRYGTETTVDINQFFVDNPDAVLGEHSTSGSMYGDNEYTVVSNKDRPLNRALPQIIRRVAVPAPKLENYTRPTGTSGSAGTPSDKPEGRYFVDSGGNLKQVSKGDEIAPSFKRKDDETRVRGMMAIRDDARRLLEMERDNAPESDLKQLRESLHGQYKTFVDKYGRLNSNQNRALIRVDPDSAFIRGLEKNRKGEWVGADVFTSRVVGGTTTPALQSAEDAFAHTFAQTGTVDFDRMGEMLGQSPSAVRDSLSSEGLIFENPETGRWESADRYLTGSVRGKLEAAQLAAEANPKFRRNIEALEKVQPEAVAAGEINVPLGASWIPANVLNQWVKDRFRPGYANRPFFRYDEALGYWVAEAKINAPGQIMRSEWGTQEMPANKILEAALLGRPISITKDAGDGSKRKVKDPVASLAAQQKVQKMQEDFENWVWEDPERGAMLADLYNRTQNDLRPRVFDGAHQTFPGMSADWQRKMRPHQRDAIYRVVQDGTALLAHEVGFGKTAVMVGASMERKRLGLSKKPMFVVPKATHAQFRDQFLEVYPQAQVLFPEEKDFDSEHRAEFLARARTGDWDAIILTMEQFERIPVRPTTEAAWQQRHVDELRDALESMEDSGETGSRTHKQIQKALKTERQRLDELQAAASEIADKKGEYFEDLGVDQLFVDEADNYKNLRYVTKMGDVKGLPQSRARRSWDMFLKSQYLQGGIEGVNDPTDSDADGFAKQGVVFATGTPVANTIAEAWTMMRYLQLKEMRKRGFQHFDAWARNYGRVTAGLEQTPSGTYKQVSRFASFNNLPELSALLQNVADIRVASEVPQMLEAQPRLVDRDGNPKRIVDKAPNYESLQKYMADLQQRAATMGEKDPTEDNMLKLSSDARRASLDIRMVDWPYRGDKPEPNPEGKLPSAAENVGEIYKQEEEDKGTQLIFLDLGTPKGDDGKDKDDGDKDDETLSKGEQQVLQDAYRVLKRELMEEGVPEEQIAFIHDYNTKQKQQALFEQVRAGDVRVLVGSTGKLGVGVNVQDRAAAIHHIDVPWRPRDIEQREGRIIRQGNKVYGPVIDQTTGEILSPGKGVKIFNYVQEGSFDEFMWQGVEKKGQAIKTLMKRYIQQRKVEDIDPLVLGAAEAKALASGDPRIMRLEELKQKVTALRLEKAAHDSTQRNATVQAETLKNQVAAQRQRLPKIEADAEIASKVLESEEDFALSVGRESHEKRADADKALKESMKDLPYKGDWRKLGEYRDLDVMAVNTDVGYQIALVNPDTKVFHQSTAIENLDNANVVTRIDNVLKGMANSADDLRKKVVQSQESLDFYESQSGKPFDNRLELAQSDKEMRALRREIEGVEGDDEPSGPAFEAEADTVVGAIITDSDDDTYQQARTKVMGEVSAAMMAGGRDYQMPTQDEIDELIAQEIENTRRQRPAEPAAPEPAPEPDADPADEVAETVAERVINEIDDRDQTGAVVISNDDIDRMIDDAEPDESTEDDLQETAEMVVDDAAGDVRDAVADNPNPAIAEVNTGAAEGPAVVAAESPPVADLTPTEVEDVTERVAERLGDDIDDATEEGKDVTVITTQDVDGMILEEVRDESLDNAPDPDSAAVDTAPSSVPTETEPAPIDDATLMQPMSQYVEEDAGDSERIERPEPTWVEEPEPVDGELDSAAEYRTWRQEQLAKAEEIFPTDERDALVQRLIAANETVHRADGRDEEWLANESEYLAETFKDRDNNIGEVGANNERRRLLQTVTKWEADAAATEPAPLDLDPEPSTVSQETVDAEPADADMEYQPDDAEAVAEPEPVATEPDKYELANQYGEMIADQSGHEPGNDEWRSVASEAYDAYLDDLEGINRPKMSWDKRVIAPTESGYAVVQPAAETVAEPEPMPVDADMEYQPDDAEAIAEPEPVATESPDDGPLTWDHVPSDMQQRVFDAVSNDAAFLNALANSDEQNARIESRAALQRAMTAVLVEDMRDQTAPLSDEQKRAIQALSGANGQLRDDQAFADQLADQVAAHLGTADDSAPEPGSGEDMDYAAVDDAPEAQEPVTVDAEPDYQPDDVDDGEYDVEDWLAERELLVDRYADVYAHQLRAEGKTEDEIADELADLRHTVSSIDVSNLTGQQIAEQNEQLERAIEQREAEIAAPEAAPVEDMDYAAVDAEPPDVSQETDYTEPEYQPDDAEAIGEPEPESDADRLQRVRDEIAAIEQSDEWAEINAITDASEATDAQREMAQRWADLKTVDSALSRSARTRGDIPAPADEMDYEAPDDAPEAPETAPVDEMDYEAPDDAPVVEAVDPEPTDGEMERRLRACEVLPAEQAVGQVDRFIQQDLNQAEEAVDAAAARFGLPSFDRLRDDAQYLEVLHDGRVVAVLEDGGIVPLEDAPEPGDRPDADISPPDATVITGEMVVTDGDVAPDPEPPPQRYVSSRRRFNDLSIEEKRQAVAEYNAALEAYREAQAVAAQMGAVDSSTAVELYCEFLKERLGDSQPGPSSGTGLASRINFVGAGRGQLGQSSPEISLPTAGNSVDLQDIQLRPAAASASTAVLQRTPPDAQAGPDDMELNPDREPVRLDLRSVQLQNPTQPVPVEDSVDLSAIDYQPGQGPAQFEDIGPEVIEFPSGKPRKGGGRRRRDDEEDRKYQQPVVQVSLAG